jgi:uncharacterized membrane protein
MHRFRVPLLLLAIVALAVGIRAADLNGPCFYSDEVNEIWLAKQPVVDIVFAPDSMPPLYPLVNKAWLAAWGSDAAARWLTVLFGAATVVCIRGIGRHLVDDATGLAGAFLLAILPLHVFYSEFVRGYVVFVFFAALALWMLLRAVQTDQRRDWCFFALAAIAGAYTHYYFVIFLAISLLIVVMLKRSLRIGKRAFVAYAAIAAAGLPLLGLMPSDFRFQTSLRDPQRLTVATFAYTYLTMFTGDALGPSPRELHTISFRDAAKGVAPWAAAIGVIVTVLGFEGWRALRGHPTLPILFALILLPVLVTGGLGYAAGLNYHVRFALWAIIALVIWLGAGLAAGRGKWYVRAATFGLLVLSAISIYNRHFVPRYENEDLRGAAAYLHTQADQAQPVFIVSDYLAKAARYYLGDEWHVVELPRAGESSNTIREAADIAAADAALKAAAAAGRPFWLIYSREFHGDPEGLLLKHLIRERHLAPAADFAGVVLYRSE